MNPALTFSIRDGFKLQMEPLRDSIEISGSTVSHDSCHTVHRHRRERDRGKLCASLRAGRAACQKPRSERGPAEIRCRRSPSPPERCRDPPDEDGGSRLTQDGVIVIVAQAQRSQKRDREEALERLLDMVREAAVRLRLAGPTKPTKASKERRPPRRTQRRSSIKAGTLETRCKIDGRQPTAGRRRA